MSRFVEEHMSELEPLLAEMVRIDSTNPGLAGGPGEAAFAAHLARRMERLGLEVDLWDVLPGRPNVVGRLAGSGGGSSLMLLGHLDVVGPWGPEAFDPAVREGRMYGRGAADMKCGFAAMLLAAEGLLAGGARLRGDLYLAGVIDEEWESAGAEALPARYRPDACLLLECTGLDVVTEHGGFAWYEIESHGVEAAGADPEHGVDAVALLAPVLAGITALDAELAARPRAAYGRGSIHASTIEGGTQLPAYPARCTLGVERCTIAGETLAQSRAEMESLLAAAHAADPRFSAELRTVVAREAMHMERDEPVVKAAAAAAEAVLGRPARLAGDIAWGDSGLLVEAGIPCVTFGPIGHGEHTAEEWVDLESVAQTAAVAEGAARLFCG
ncbi:MAG TPA: M20/M25/M40 family metallo-hydrolase [Thermoleophilia bacterium]|nr:M20/M25/M40 family metallo-hydrolase [Thermoleophilia bacterium]